MKTRNLLAIVSAMVMIIAGSAQAQTTYTRQNNTTNLNAAEAWSVGGPPTGSDIAKWDATCGANVGTALGGSVTWGQILLTNNVGNAVIIANTASATQTLNGVSGTGIDMSAANQNLTINNPVTLGGAQTWNVGSGRTLTVSQNYIVNNGGFLLTIDGSGSTTWSGINQTTATLTGSGGLTKNGSGRFSFAGNNTGYSGTTILNGGVTIVTGVGSLGSGNLTLNGGVYEEYWSNTFIRELGNGPGQVQLIGGDSGFSENGSTGMTIKLGNGTATVVWGALGEGSATGFFNPSTFILESAAAQTGSTLDFQNGINLNGATRTIASYKTSNLLSGATISGAITGTSASGLIKDGAGILILSNTGNTYNGTTTISAGTLQANSTSAIGNSSAANTLIFNGGTLRAGGAITSVAGRGVTMTSTGIIDNNGQAISIAGDISGAGGMTKNGTGTLTLTGTSSYGGATTVNAGTLAVNSPGSLAASSAVAVNNGGTLTGSGTFNGAVTVNSGGTLLGTPTISAAVAATSGYLVPGGYGTLGTLILSSGLTLNGGNGITCDLGTTSGSSDTIAITGNLVLNGTDYVVFNVPTGSAAANATYTNMTWTGSQTGSGTLVFPNGLTTMNGATLNINANSVTITTGGSGITTGNRNVTWFGTSYYVWDGSTVNWKEGTTPTAYAYGDNVTFDDNGGAANPVTGFPATPGSVTVSSSSSKNYTIAATIGGSGALTKSGSSTLTLSGANTYSGGTIISGGGVIYTADANLGLAGSRNLTFNGTSTLTWGFDGSSLGSLTINAGAAATLSSINTISFPTTAGSGKILASGGQNKTVSLGDASTFSGDVVLAYNANNNSGVGTPHIQFAKLNDAVSSSLQFYRRGGGTDSGQQGQIALTGDAGALTFNNRQVQLLPKSGTSNPSMKDIILLNNNGTIANKWLINTSLNNRYDRDVNFYLAGSNSGDNEFAGSIGNSTNGGFVLSMIKDGAGKWILSGSNTYSGVTTVNLGTLTIQNADALGSTSAGTSVVANGPVLQLQGNISFAAEPLSLPNNNNNPVLMKNLSGSNTWNGTITTTGNPAPSYARISSDAGLLTLASTINGDTNANASVVLQGDGAITVSGKITGSSGLISGSVGSGIRTVSNTANDYTGKTGISGGTLSINSLANVNGGASALGAPTNAANGTIGVGSTTSGGTLQYTGSGHASDRVINLAGTTGGATLDASGIGVLVLTTNLTATGVGSKTLTLTGTSTATNTLAGAIVDNSGANKTSLIKTDVGTWVLSGSNTYTGTTIVRVGTLTGVTGGSCLGSSLTVTNTPGNTSALAIRVTNTSMPWSCANLAFTTNGVGAQLKFSFAVAPSTSLAPLSITNNLTFTGAPLVVVNTANIPPGKYPLMVCANNQSVVPALDLIGSLLKGTLSWGGDNKTLYLTLVSKATLIRIL